MKKRILMILAVAILLVGCGNTDKPDTEANKPQTETDNTTEALGADTEEETTVTESEKPHEHAYTESTSKEATCTEAGEKTFTCDCGDTYTEVIEATGHSYGKYTYNNDATTEKDGTETATCSTCGKTKTRTKEGTKLEPESGDPCNVPGLPFVPFQIYDEGDIVYYWYPQGAYDGYGTFSSQKNAAYAEGERIMTERFGPMGYWGFNSAIDTYYHKCSWGNTYDTSGTRSISYAKFYFYKSN